MDQYDFSLHQEVLMEKGAGVLGDLFRFQQENRIESEEHPVSVMYQLLWSAKQDILRAQTEKELDRIDGMFCLAASVVRALEAQKTT